MMTLRYEVSSAARAGILAARLMAVGYPGTMLAKRSGSASYRISVPDVDEVKRVEVEAMVKQLEPTATPVL
jgi:hypothetical protein